MIDLLELIHLIKDLLLHMVVSPADVKIHTDDRISYLHIFVLLSHQLHHRVLRLFILASLPLTLITTFG